MPRLRRHVRPGALIHIIVRFVNFEFLLTSQEERDEYLRRARTAFLRSDWRALSFALMSTHTHFAAIAGRDEFAVLSRSWHVGFIGWLNPRRQRLGAGIANRPSTREVPLSACARLIAYHHNNPVRAGVVASAAQSSWTSHQYYTGQAASDWLHVELGLELAGFDASTAGRAAFAEYVHANRSDSWDVKDADLRSVRRAARRELGPIVELGQPHCDAETTVPLWTPRSATPRVRWSGSLQRIADAVGKQCRIDPHLLSSASRKRTVAGARRIFLLVARDHAGRSLTEAAAFLTLSVQAASKLVRNPAAEARAAAAQIALHLGITEQIS